MLRHIGSRLQHACSKQVSGHLSVRSHVSKNWNTAVYRCLSGFHLKKITSEFDNIYDTNKDGIVDPKDIEGFKQRLRKYAEMTQLRAVKETYKASYEDYWILLQEFCDTNKDGELSREEWIEMWTNIVESAKDGKFTSLPQWVQLMPYNIFPIMDSKGDGVLDTDEYWNYWYHVCNYPRPTEAELEQIFDVMTEGGKYKMNLQRVQDLYADFYLSSDPNSPGRYISGPIQLK